MRKLLVKRRWIIDHHLLSSHVITIMMFLKNQGKHGSSYLLYNTAKPKHRIYIRPLVCKLGLTPVKPYPPGWTESQSNAGSCGARDRTHRSSAYLFETIIMMSLVYQSCFLSNLSARLCLRVHCQRMICQVIELLFCDAFANALFASSWGQIEMLTSFCTGL